MAKSPSHVLDMIKTSLVKITGVLLTTHNILWYFLCSLHVLQILLLLPANHHTSCCPEKLHLPVKRDMTGWLPNYGSLIWITCMGRAQGYSTNTVCVCVCVLPQNCCLNSISKQAAALKLNIMKQTVRVHYRQASSFNQAWLE